MHVAVTEFIDHKIVHNGQLQNAKSFTISEDFVVQGQRQGQDLWSKDRTKTRTFLEDNYTDKNTKQLTL